jgi:hypothetical protein
MAYRWWGNLVTCATWHDFWPNQGITAFMVAAWKEHDLGEAAYRQELGVARRRAEQVREIGFDKPLAWYGQYPSLRAEGGAIQQRRPVPCSSPESDRAAAFWRRLRGFTTQHAGKTVASQDFQRCDSVRERARRCADVRRVGLWRKTASSRERQLTGPPFEGAKAPDRSPPTREAKRQRSCRSKRISANAGSGHSGARERRDRSAANSTIQH